MSTESYPADAVRILTAISHELRNLLQSISGCNQLIEDALADQQLDRVAGYWRIGHQKQEALSNVLQDILFLSENGIPQSADANLTEVFSRVIQSVSRQAELANVALVCDLPQADMANLYYPDILQRCIQNVLEFSVRSCPENGSGRVWVGVHHDVALQLISIEIVDNGCKLNTEELKLFSSSWWQFDQWNRFLISLAVSMKIAQGLDGELAVKNCDISGKSFTVILNASKESNSAVL